MNTFIIQSLNTFTLSLLEKVSADYGLNLDELKGKYMDASVPETKTRKPVSVTGPRVIKTKCTGLTSKGGPCRNCALPDTELCKSHAVKAAKPARESKKVKRPPAPMHNHEPGETPIQECQLCESHGDAMIPDIDNAQYEVMESEGLTINERLRNMLKSEKWGDEED